MAHRHSHLSDHAAITTAVLLPATPAHATRPSRNWGKIDVSQFRNSLETRLKKHLSTILLPAYTEVDLDHDMTLLASSVIDTMDQHVPQLPLNAGEKHR